MNLVILISLNLPESIVQQLQESNILPNNSQSEEGKWYKFNGEYKIERIRAKDDIATESHDLANLKYRFSIKFPTAPRTGLYPKELVLMGLENPDDQNWACYWYHMYEEDIPKEIKRMARKIRDLHRANEILKNRNRKLEKHFSRTAYDESQEFWKMDWKESDCEKCGKKIDKKKSIEGQHFVYLSEGEIIHLECAVDSFDSICSECGGVWESDDHDCECGGKLYHEKDKNEIRKHLVYNAVTHYLPKELHDKVVLKLNAKK